MNEIWLIYACGILLTRLVYLTNDARLGRATSVWQLGAQAVLVFGLFQLSVSSGILLALLVAIAVAVYLLETPQRIQGGFPLRFADTGQ